MNPLLEIFSKEKIVNSRILNQLGVQPFRIVAARSLRNVRPYRPKLSTQIQQESERLINDGLLTIPNFLPKDLFESIQKEASVLVNDPTKVTRTLQSGPNTLFAYDFDNKSLSIDLYPAIQEFYTNPHLLALFEKGLNKKIQQKNITKWMERLVQGDGIRSDDNQTQIHSDTYYDTYKAWLYLEDVTLEQAPFAYIKGTQKIALDRLEYDYKNSVQDRPSPSRIITKEEIQKRNLEETIVTCKANTLAIANTFGYHRRLEGVSGYSRLALYASVRFHPFKP